MRVSPSENRNCRDAGPFAFSPPPRGVPLAAVFGVIQSSELLVTNFISVSLEGRREGERVGETSRSKGNVRREAEGGEEMDSRRGCAGGELTRHMCVLVSLGTREPHLGEDRGDQLATKVTVIKVWAEVTGVCSLRWRGGGGARLSVGGLEEADLFSELRAAKADQIAQHRRRLGTLPLETQLLVEQRQVVLFRGQQSIVGVASCGPSAIATERGRWGNLPKYM